MIDEPPALRSEPPPSARAEVRSMSIAAATAWSSGIVLAFWMLMIMIAPPQGSGESSSNLIGNSACQAIAYLFGLFLILRAHAPDASIRSFLGVRSTHVAFYPLAILLGVAVQIPVQTLYNVISRRFPSSPETEDRLARVFAESGPLQQIMIGVILIALGPLVEEIFFRGALFRPLRKRYAPSLVVTVTSLFFAVSHGMPQMFLPIALIGAAMGIVRAASGSLVPSLLLHATFNAVPFYALATARASDPGAAEDPQADILPPLWMTGASVGVALVLLALVLLVGARSAEAARAREADLQ